MLDLPLLLDDPLPYEDDDDDPLEEEDDLPRDPPPPLRPGAGLAWAPLSLPASRTTAMKTKATMSARKSDPLCLRFMSAAEVASLDQEVVFDAIMGTS